MMDQPQQNHDKILILKSIQPSLHSEGILEHKRLDFMGAGKLRLDILVLLVVLLLLWLHQLQQLGLDCV